MHLNNGNYLKTVSSGLFLISIIFLNLSSCLSTKKIPIERQSGCFFNPKDSTYNEWVLRFDKYPKLLNETDEYDYFQKNLRFSKIMEEHQIRFQVTIRAYLKTDGKFSNFRVSEFGDYDCYKCDSSATKRLRADCQKEAIRLLKGMTYSPAILKDKKVSPEKLFVIKFDYDKYRMRLK